MFNELHLAKILLRLVNQLVVLQSNLLYKLVYN